MRSLAGPRPSLTAVALDRPRQHRWSPATPIDRGASLSWGAVAGATIYNVYRDEVVFGCDWGKEFFGTTTGTSFVDQGLKSGFGYNYIVVPVGPGSTCFGPASSCTALTPATGANLALDPIASGAFAFTQGDGDVFLDNCEEGSVTVTVANTGNAVQTNVRIVGVQSVDHPGVVATSTLPLLVDASMAVCDATAAAIGIYADGLVLGDVVDLEIEVTSDQLSPLTRTRIVLVAMPGTESDIQSFASKTFSFEADLEDWQLQEGVFDRTGTGGGDGTTFFVDSSDTLDSQCDRIRSPVMDLSATSTLSLWNNYDLEPLSGGTRYDRANSGVIDGAGDRTLVTPDGGRLYNADSSGPGNYGGFNEPEEGWADTADTWDTSSWTAAALQSATFAGDFVQMEVVYGTDADLYQPTQRRFQLDTSLQSLDRFET